MTQQDNAVMVIAEIGSVHDGSLGNVLKLIEAAGEVGADAAKFQTHIAVEETIRDAPTPAYFSAEDRFSYFDRTGFSPREWQLIKQHCDDNAVEFMSSPFSEAAVDLLESLSMQHYKIPSGEVTNLPMLEKIAAISKPVILSSGMSNWVELDEAVNVFSRKNCPLTVLQCSSRYPCPSDAVGLNVMQEMARRYNCAVGLSDHTHSAAASIAAVTLGATVIEKHFTFSRLMYGSDAKHSMEPEEFRSMVGLIREVESMSANPVDKSDVSHYVDMKFIFQKSLVASHDLEAGTTLQRCDIGVKKPGSGLAPKNLELVLGRKLKCSLRMDALLALNDFE
ncbi:MAG: N,N'-diacetyllegionaminate synthase [Parasphingorhabdus sp.]|jgi:N,N'-diacetyllegionaminate synthase